MGHMERNIWSSRGGLRDNLLVSVMLLQGGLCFSAARGFAQDGAAQGASEGVTQGATQDATQDDATPDEAQSLTVFSGSAFRVEVMRRTRLQKGRAIQGRLA